jgi:hypothetical protein
LGEPRAFRNIFFPDADAPYSLAELLVRIASTRVTALLASEGIFFSRSDFHIFAWPDFPSININSFKINVIN